MIYETNLTDARWKIVAEFINKISDIRADSLFKNEAFAIDDFCKARHIGLKSDSIKNCFSRKSFNGLLFYKNSQIKYNLFW